MSSFFFFWKYLLRSESKNYYTCDLHINRYSPNLYKAILIIETKISFRDRSKHMMLSIIIYKCHRMDKHNYYSDEFDLKEPFLIKKPY